MRARKKKHTGDRMEKCAEYLIKEPELYKGRWKEVFGNDNEIRLEIGCGKGTFITTLALENPSVNFIAIEKISDILVMALEKAQGMKLKNVKFINGDAQKLTQYFSDGEISLIYLNFSDPWPRNGNRKRRLTHSVFLELYKKCLKPNSALFFKTDNQKLFEFSINEFSDFGLRLKNITFDLHNSKFEGNIMTEYEKRFYDEGKPIYRCEAYFI